MRDAFNKAVKQDTATHHSVSPHQQQPQPIEAQGEGSQTSSPLYPFDSMSRSTLSSATLQLLSPSLSFLRWLTQFLIDCQHPAAAYERHCAALEMLRLVIVTFNLQHQQQQHSAGHIDGTTEHAETPVTSLDSHLVRHAVLTPLLTASSTLVLLSGVGRAWQAVRFLSYSILVSAFPSPLPGFASRASVRRLLEWSLSLSSSPRARDSEAGALAIKLVFIKYVKQLRWVVPLQHIAHSMQRQQRPSMASAVELEWRISSSSASAVFDFLCSIRALLVSQLSLLRSTPLSLRYTAAHARLHGVVRLFRLVIEEVEYAGWHATDERRCEWTVLVSDMLRVLSDIAIVALKLHVPKQAHRLMQAAIRADLDDAAHATDHSTDNNAPLNDEMQSARVMQSSPDSGAEEDEHEEAGRGVDVADIDVEDEDDADIASVDCRGHAVLAGSELDGSSAQLIVVSSWLTIKEVCLLLGAWVNTCPLSLSDAEREASDSSTAGSGVSLLGVRDVRRIGGVFLSVLGHSKHNGVLENAHSGLLQVCERLLSLDEVAQRVVGEWLEELMRRVRAADDDSWLRRSRGIAYALLAILKAEPSSRPPVLLSRAMESVLQQAGKAASPSDGSASEWRSVVHGLNLLRSLFRDSSLHVGCLPYVSGALEVSISGFSHSVWAVRNSALISFAPIALKAIRAQYNQQMKQQSGMTARELFSLYPDLQPFLLRHLAQATATTDAANRLHPTLYPLLMILSRLRAAHNVAGERRMADVQPFTDALHSLTSHPHYQARRMAARALLALTDTEQRQTVMTDVAQQLPHTADELLHGSTDWNTVDGRLLQLTTLFDGWRAQHDGSREGWVESFVGQLLARDWLGSAAVPIPAIRLSYLSLLTSAELSLPDHHHLRSMSGLRRCLTSLAVCCEPSSQSSFVGVGGADMRSQAASLLLRLLLSVRETVDATEVCLSLLSDGDVAVSRGAMELVLFVVPRRHVRARINLAAVHAALCASLAGLTHPPTLSVALSLLTALDAHLSSAAAVGVFISPLADASLWSCLLAAAGSGNVDVQAAALPCLGRAVRAAVESFLQSLSPSVAALQAVLARCTDWLVCLSGSCDDLRVPAVRHAVWASINHSGCIQSATQPTRRQCHVQLSLSPPIAVAVPHSSASWPSGPWCVRSLSDVDCWLWQLVLRLMCDESAAIRDDAAALAYVTLDLAETAATNQRENQPLQPPLPSTLFASNRTRLPAVSVVSAVLERSFVHFASTFACEQAIAFMLQLFAAHSSDGQQHTQHSAAHACHRPPLAWPHLISPSLC